MDEVPYDGAFKCLCSGDYAGPNCQLLGPKDLGCHGGEIVLGEQELKVRQYACDCSGLPDERKHKDENCNLESYIAAEAVKKKELEANVASIAGGMAAAIFVGVALYRWRQRVITNRPINWQVQLARMVKTGEIAPEQARTDRKPREIRRKDLALVKVIGSGAFGEVWKGVLDESFSRNTPEFSVAAKTVLDAKESPEATSELLSEASVMAQVAGHRHLVSIIGVITRGDPLVLVLQFCEHGSLQSFLRTRAAEGSSVNFCDKLTMAKEIALGMEHLSSLHFIHRDLAARNVLVSDGKKVIAAKGDNRTSALVCKIADFGLSRSGGKDIAATEDYYKSTRGVFPVRWTAPEAMETLRFTVASDVWSFGVVVIELVQDGENPYHGTSNPDVMKLTMSGGRHPKPAGCPDRLYGHLMQCWDVQPEKRPTFKVLAEVFRALAGAAVQAPDFHQQGGKKPMVSAGNEYSTFGFEDDTNTLDAANAAANSYFEPSVQLVRVESNSDIVAETCYVDALGVTVNIKRNSLC